jgi:hypothetical protein
MYGAGPEEELAIVPESHNATVDAGFTHAACVFQANLALNAYDAPYS